MDTLAPPVIPSLEELTANVEAHIKTPGYIGRVLILGVSDQGYSTAIYALMGRRPSSKNRKFVATGTETGRAVVKTEALDPSAIDRPELLIYTAMSHTQLVDGSWVCVASNGDQTDDLLGMKSLQDFEQILATRDYEPDPPINTARISGMLRFNGGLEIMMSIIRSGEGSIPPISVRRTFSDLTVTKGVGHMLSTYVGDGDPPPTFRHDEPILVPLKGCAKDMARSYWTVLDPAYRVTLVVQTFHLDGRTREFLIVDPTTKF